MYKRLLTSALAALTLCTCTAIPVAAEPVTADAQEHTGTFFFDPGTTWDSERIDFYIWDATSQPTMYATANGWVDSDVWGSKKTKGTKLEDGTFESYEVTLRDDHEYYLILHDPNTDAQTLDCVLTPEAFGDTAEFITDEIYESPTDSEGVLFPIRFRKSGLSDKMKITPMGTVQGHTITKFMDPAKEVAEFINKYYGATIKLTDEPIVTKETVANAIEKFGTNADDVWAKYLEITENDDIQNALVKNVIFPDEEPSDPSIVHTGTFFFDPGTTWDSERIDFYIWDATSQPTMYATANGWVDSDVWGSKKTKGTKLEDGTFESYEVTLRDDHEYYLILHDPNTDAQTLDCVLTPEAFGDTAEFITDEIYESPTDSEGVLFPIRFRKSGLSDKMKITPMGTVQGHTITKFMDPAKEVAEFINKYYGATIKLTDEPIVTKETVANAIEKFGTNADDVWAKYLEITDHGDAEKAEVKAVIYPENDPDITPSAKLADADGDGTVNSGDAMKILQAALSMNDLSASIADINTDGTIDSADALIALRYSVGIKADDTNVLYSAYGEPR